MQIVLLCIMYILYIIIFLYIIFWLLVLAFAFRLSVPYFYLSIQGKLWLFPPRILILLVLCAVARIVPKMLHVRPVFRGTATTGDISRRSGWQQHMKVLKTYCDGCLTEGQLPTLAVSLRSWLLFCCLLFLGYLLWLLYWPFPLVQAVY